jgi:hypothetical protein
MNASTRAVLRRCLLWSALALSACSHTPKRVDCEARLEPINAPTAVAGEKKATGPAGDP